MTPFIPPLRYHGGKAEIGKWIISCFPPHICYVEPYGGGASVLLQKSSSPIEVYNDLCGDVVNFFKVLRDRPNDLIRAIQLTPYSRLEKKLAYQASDNDLEAARRFYVRSWQGYGGSSLKQDTGWRYLYQRKRSEDVVGQFNRTEHLWKLVERLKSVLIECDEALNVIKRYGRNSDVLLYCDPPYPHSVRSGSGAYNFEMIDADHIALADALHSTEAMAVVSGYDKYPGGKRRLAKIAFNRSDGCCQRLRLPIVSAPLFRLDS